MHALNIQEFSSQIWLICDYFNMAELTNSISLNIGSIPELPRVSQLDARYLMVGVGVVNETTHLAFYN